MKKIVEKDKNRRKQFSTIELKCFIFKSILNNFNYLNLIRWNAGLKLKILTQYNSKVSITNRCLLTNNRKRFNKLTGFSRHVFLKKIRSGEIVGIKKSSW